MERNKFYVEEGIPLAIHANCNENTPKKFTTLTKAIIEATNQVRGTCMLHDEGIAQIIFTNFNGEIDTIRKHVDEIIESLENNTDTTLSKSVVRINEYNAKVTIMGKTKGE